MKQYQHHKNTTAKNDSTKGMLYGLLGVIGFSLTPTSTRMAVEYLDPAFVGLGRAVVAGGLAGMLLAFLRAPIPGKQYFKSLCIIALCIAVLFPLLSAWSLYFLTASHTGVVLGIIPLATAIAGAMRTGERPSVLFWLVSLCGAVAVVIFSLVNNDGHFQTADTVLFAAIIAAAVGYSEGAHLTAILGGWQVICWSLALALPFLLLPFFLFAWPDNFTAPASAWIGFFYLALSSQLLSFFPWYHGLALGGITRVSQLMLLMPFMTLFSSQYLLNDIAASNSWWFAVLIIFIVALSKHLANKTKTIRKEEP